MDSKQEASLFSQILFDNLKNEGKNFSPRFGDRLANYSLCRYTMFDWVSSILFVRRRDVK